MSDQEEEQIAQARRRDEQRAQELGEYTPVEQVLTLAAEVERLRTENAAMRPIVEAVAAIKEGGDGGNDKRPYDAQISLLTITQARALLAKE